MLCPLPPPCQGARGSGAPPGSAAVHGAGGIFVYIYIYIYYIISYYFISYYIISYDIIISYYIILEG